MAGATVVALVAAVTALLGWITDSRMKARESRRKDVNEPLIAISNSAATLVAAMESAIAPLRAEIANLNAEVISLRFINTRLEGRVRLLTDLLSTHGINVPGEGN